MPQRDRGQGTRNKDFRRWKMREKRKGARRGAGIFCPPEWDKGLPLEREQTSMLRKKMAVGKGGNSVLA